MKMSTGNHQFANVPSADIERSSFDRSHGYKTTMNAGDLVPFFVDEVLPGDTFNLNVNHFARLATPWKPFMDNLFFDTFFFFVPNRLVLDDWKHLMGEQDNPDDPMDAYVVPLVAAPPAGWASGSLGDYFGLPTLQSTANASCLAFRSYNLIWNEWFRDENLQDSVTVKKDQTHDPYNLYNVLKRGKRHDYFTSCLPWPQKGPSISLPIGGEADVLLRSSTATANKVVKAADHTDMGNNYNMMNLGPTMVADTDPYTAITIDPNGTLFADLSTATPVTINALREAFQMQKLAERDARGGTRYTEIVRSHFGVISPDARLQRPEYLGGGSSPVNVNPVANTAGGDLPQGNLAAYATCSGRSGFVKSFTEHGILIGLCSIRADLSYQQGMNRMWQRQGKYDFYWPALAHLGEQAVTTGEIYWRGSNNSDIFGYQERYAEYRYKPSLITGKFRSNDPQTLDIWHLAQNFSGLPTLSPAFIQENPPVARVIQVPSEPHFLLDCYFKLTCARPMPVFSVPGLIDHF